MHKNARLTPKGRALMLRRLKAGQHQQDVAQAMGISLTTLKKWLRRYRTEGRRGLQDRSSRSLSDRGVPAQTREAVIERRRQRHVHKNALLTPKGRALMLRRLEAGEHQRDVAQAVGVSFTTLRKWLRRYRKEGPQGLQDRSSRPRNPRAIPAQTRQAVIKLHRRGRTGQFIAVQLGLSPASVSRIVTCRSAARVETK